MYVLPAGWSPGYKLLQSQLQAKKASLLQTKVQSVHVCHWITKEPDHPIDCCLHFDNINVDMHSHCYEGLVRIVDGTPINSIAPVLLKQSHYSARRIFQDFNPT